MITVDCEQGTGEWLRQRCGHTTASRVKDALAMLKKGGEANERRKYRIQMVCERLTFEVQDTYVSPAMQRGTELEPLARAAYEVSRDVMVEQVGFVVHPDIRNYGASPDGLVGEDGLIEIKCPQVATHIEWVLDGVAPEEHQLQMLSQMDCTERQWCDFVSYCPELPENLQLFVVRFPRDEKRIQEIREGVQQFNSEVDALIAQLKEWKCPEASMKS